MIRIIYTWNVQSKNLETFIEIWKKTTNSIHKSVKGARGSFMLQNHNDLSEIKTIARWDSLEDWKNFWQDSKPQQMSAMHELGERVSVEIYTEVDDFTH